MEEQNQTSVSAPNQQQQNQHKQKERISHDRLFKQLIETFFEEFMRCFFPDIHKQIDSTHVRFLPKEVFTDITAGEKREVDLLVETKLLNVPCLLIIHAEEQEEYQPNFPERMFVYFGRLYEKYRCIILPIAMFAHGKNIQEPDQFTIELPFKKVLTFEFLVVQLKQKNWREFLRQDNPVAAALMSRAGYTKKERVQMKLEFLLMITRFELNPAKMQLIVSFFETYLRLGEQEEMELTEKIHQLQPKEETKIMELYTSWELRGMQKGVQQGMEKGMQQGMQQGMEQGMQQGMQQGERMAKLELARKLLAEGLLSTEKIIELTGLTKEEIEQHSSS